MSLSFVSSAVLSSSDGVSHNEEKPIETQEASDLRSKQGGGSNKPLFEQLQHNKDREQDKYDEMTKAMRGSRTLDEEDCAHLDSVESMREKRDTQVRQRIEEEVAGFRAARADRSLAGVSSVVVGTTSSVATKKAQQTTDGEKQGSSGVNTAEVFSNKKVPLVPFVPVVKKRRRRVVLPKQQSSAAAAGNKPLSRNVGESGRTNNSSTSTTTTQEGIIGGENNSEAKKKKARIDECKDDEPKEEAGAGKGGNSLGGLLGGYGSDSDSDSDD